MPEKVRQHFFLEFFGVFDEDLIAVPGEVILVLGLLW